MAQTLAIVIFQSACRLNSANRIAVPRHRLHRHQTSTNTSRNATATVMQVRTLTRALLSARRRHTIVRRRARPWAYVSKTKIAITRNVMVEAPLFQCVMRRRASSRVLRLIRAATRTSAIITSNRRRRPSSRRLLNIPVAYMSRRQMKRDQLELIAMVVVSATPEELAICSDRCRAIAPMCVSNRLLENK